DGQVRVAVFIDAILPHPGQSWFETAPAALAEPLRALARDGWLPPWHRWFPPEVLAAALPTPDLRARFIAELPELPLVYLEALAPVIEGWPPPSCAYVQLSPAYEREVREA